MDRTYWGEIARHTKNGCRMPDGPEDIDRLHDIAWRLVKREVLNGRFVTVEAEKELGDSYLTKLTEDCGVRLDEMRGFYEARERAELDLAKLRLWQLYRELRESGADTRASKINQFRSTLRMVRRGIDADWDRIRDVFEAEFGR